MTTDTTKPTSIKELAISRRDAYELDPASITIQPGWNVREFNLADPDDESLVLSIIANGVQQPLHINFKDGIANLTDGHRRLGAVMEARKRGAEIKSVPVKLADKNTSEADLLLKQIVLNSGKPLTPLQTGSVFKRFLDYGWSVDDIAGKVGKSGQYVRDMLALQAAPAEIRESIQSGEISATLANVVLKKAKGDTKAATATIKAAGVKAKASVKAGRKAKITAKHVKQVPSVQEVDLPQTSEEGQAKERAFKAFNGNVNSGSDRRLFMGGWNEAAKYFAAHKTPGEE